VGTAYANLSQAQAESGDFEGALQSLERAEAILAKSYGPTSPNYRVTVAVHARLLQHRGYRLEAFARYRTLMTSLAPEAKTYADSSAAQLAALPRESFGGSLVEDGRGADAIDYLRAAIRIFAAQPMYSSERQAFGAH